MVERTRRAWWALVALVILDGWLHDASAIPAFTRKFDMDCSYCHTVAPALNTFGEAFRSQGFRMAALAERLPEEMREQVRKEIPDDLPPAYWPLSARAVVGYSYRSLDRQDTDRGEAKVQTRSSGIERFKLMMGGLLAENVAFYLTYLPTVANIGLGSEQRQEGELESAWIRFNELPVGSSSVKVNLKLGSFELDVPVSGYRRHSLSSYPIYGYFPDGSPAADDPETTLDWSERQLGAEVSGQAPWELSYSFALINGTNGHADSNKAFDYYLRVSRPLADHRVGGFLYWGTSPTDFEFTPTDDPIPGTGRANHTFYRVGFDGDFLLEAPLRLRALALYGSDAAELFNGTNPQTAAFAGGFLEAQYDLLKDWATILVLRYDMIRNFDQGDASTEQKKGDLDGATVAARYRFIETNRLALLFHGEYSHVKVKLTSVDGNDQTDNRITVAFDLMM